MKSKKRPGGQGHDDPIIVVSGLPRSGTSMMMKMLAAGGVEVMTDNYRTPDENNPKGYFEFERVKKMTDGDTSWMVDARGKSIKIISYLLEQMPSGYTYKVIFMQRELDEILASQKRMLQRDGKPESDVSDAQMKDLYRKHLNQVKAWLSTQPNIEVHYPSYNEIMDDPKPHVTEIIAFLGMDLDELAMVGVVDQALYRERSQ